MGDPSGCSMEKKSPTSCFKRARDANDMKNDNDLSNSGLAKKSVTEQDLSKRNHAVEGADAQYSPTTSSANSSTNEIPAEELEAIHHELDVDKDGELSTDELWRATDDEFYIDEDELRNHPALYEARKTLRKLSKEADKDSDGHITPLELKSFLVASHQMLEKLRPDEAEEEMKDDDEVKDGEEENNKTYSEEGEGGDDAEPTNPTTDSNKPETQADSNPADKEGTKGKK